MVLATMTAFARPQASTLRIDCIFSGTDKEQEISVARLSDAGEWAGRTVNMDKLALRGNGQISVRDSASAELLYANSFSTLFQEWQNTEEATKVRKAFENVFLVPMPERKATVTIELFNHRGERAASVSFPVDPEDILIRKASGPVAEHRYLLGERGSGRIDLAIVAEGYGKHEKDMFFEDAGKAMASIFSHSPFKEMKDRFNVVAVALESRDSGVSTPHDASWKDTALDSHFDTFYSERYLTTSSIFKLHDALAGIDYEHILILANTGEYGGGGIFNSYLLSAAHNKWTSPVIVHEFGHSFAGLADEYFYDDQYAEYYFPDVEPWEPNISTLKDFGAKWKDMLPEGTRPVTKLMQVRNPEYYAPGAEGFRLGIYEGAGYQSEGVYRAYPQCRMKVNDYPDFCPVCVRAIARMIDFYTLAY